MDKVQVKKCTKCKLWKEYDKFYICSGYPKSECKDCTKSQKKLYRKKVKTGEVKSVKRYNSKGIERVKKTNTKPTSKVYGWNGDSEIYC